MAEDVKVPKVGKVNKKWVWGAIGVVGVYVAYKWYSASGSGSSADSVDYTTPSVDAGVDSSGVVGSAASGNVQYAGTTTDGTDTTVVNTNAHWTNQAVTLLSNAGYDPSTVYAALGDYLSGNALTSSEQTIVRAALAAVGNPPVGGPYTIREQVGESTMTAPANVRQWKAPDTTRVAIQWDKVPGALYYRIFKQGSSEPIGASTDTTAYVSGLQPNTSVAVQVAAMSTLNKQGPLSTAVTFKTASAKLTAPKTPSVSGITNKSAVVSTSAVSGANGYNWYVNGVAHGHSDAPKYTLTSLKSKTTYQVSVAADNNTQAPGPQSGRKSFKTK